MNLLDVIILVIIIICALAGFKNGFITSVVAFAGTLLVLILAFYLKNPVSVFLYEHLPFFGNFKGMSIINILIYEGLSYLLTLVILSFIMGIIIKISGLFSKIVHATVILTLPSKILGAVCGFVEGVMLAFFVVFLLSLVSPLSSLFNNSKYADTLVTKTPVLSSIVKDTYNSVTEIYYIATKSNNKDEANYDSLRVLLKYEILSTDSAEDLVNSGKLKIDGAMDLINEYRRV